jgi:hypothetical protein
MPPKATAWAAETVAAAEGAEKAEEAEEAEEQWAVEHQK